MSQSDICKIALCLVSHDPSLIFSNFNESPSNLDFFQHIMRHIANFGLGLVLQQTKESKMKIPGNRGNELFQKYVNYFSNLKGLLTQHPCSQFRKYDFCCIPLVVVVNTNTCNCYHRSTTPRIMTMFIDFDR